MAQWLKLNSLCQQNQSFHNRIMELYSRILFPYKIRSAFAEWIEAQDWQSIDVTTENGTQQAEVLFNDLLARIQAMEDIMQNSDHYELEKIIDLRLARQQLKKLVDDRYGTFVLGVKRCLQEEQLLLDSCCTEKSELKRKTRDSVPSSEEALTEIRQKLKDLHQQIAMAENFVHDVGRQQEDFSIVYTRHAERLAYLERELSVPSTNREEQLSTKRQIELEQDKQLQENSARRTSMADAHVSLAIRLAYLLQMIWSEIRKWQYEQKLAIAALAKPHKGTLDSIDAICDEGGQLLHRMILQVEKALVIFRKFASRGSSPDEKMKQLEMVLKELIKDYLPKHLQSAFIVDGNIPDRILAVDSGKSTTFRMNVRILGGRALGLGFSRPTVKMSLVSERELSDMRHSPHRITGNPDECNFTVDTNGRCTAEFQGVRIENTKLQSAASGGEDSALRKFAFVFQSTVHVCGCDISLQVVSLPIILTNHPYHEVTARGLLLWDARFSEQSRKAFSYKETVKWADLANLLNTLFINNTGRGLTSEHLDYLAKMLFNERRSLDFSNMPVTEKQAIKHKLPGRPFSFWSWVWANMVVVRDLVNGEWKAGLIHGFISKDDVRRKLMGTSPGTFLLRFSESNIDETGQGYLTVAVVERDPSNGQTKLYHVRDYLSPKDVADKGLSMILNAMEVADPDNHGYKKPLLRYLWPETMRPFTELFEPYNRHSYARHSLGGLDENIGTDDKYTTSKFSIEIFLNDEAVVPIMGRMQRQDSLSSSMTSVSMHESMSDISIADDVSVDAAERPHSPQYGLCVSPEMRRPMAAVLPQIQATSAAGSQQQRVRSQQVLPQSHSFHGTATAPVAATYGSDSDDSMGSFPDVGGFGAQNMAAVSGLNFDIHLNQ